MSPNESRRRRRTLLVAVLTVLALGSLSACVSREQGSGRIANPTVAPSQLTGVALHVGDQKGGTEALLRAAGELKDLPYKVDFSTFTSGPPEIEAATAGKIDFAVTGNTPPIFGAASSAKIKIVAGYSNQADGDVILTTNDSSLGSVPSLRGKKVAVAKGSSAHANLLKQLDKAGLRLGTDVTPVYLQPADALSAFTSKAVDAWAIWDPYTAIVQRQTGAKTLATGTGVLNGFGFGVASDSALADGPRNTALRDLVTRIAKASQWARGHVQEWSTQFATATGIDPPAALAAQKRSVRTAVELTPGVAASEQDLTDAFGKSGQIQNTPKVSDYVDDRYNDAIRPFATPGST